MILAVPAFATGAKANDLIIAAPTTFSSLDGSANDSDGVANGVLTVDNLVIMPGGSITFNDPASPRNASAGPIKIVVTGDVLIEAGGAITAENQVSGGSGGDITITAGDSISVEGTDGVNPGALISSRKWAGSGSTGHSGSITINAPSINIGDGAVVTAGRNMQTDLGSAGAITLNGQFLFIDGEVSARSGMTSTNGKQLPGGGPITIDSTLLLTVSPDAVISSQGLDPGADLVHLQGALVFIQGLIQSTGSSNNSAPNCPPNHLGSSCQHGYSSNATGGVEIWADDLTIDGLDAYAEISADTNTNNSNNGCSGASGTGWINIFAGDDLEIFGPATGAFAVHANGLAQNTAQGGTITVKCVSGDVVLDGLALQADATSSWGKGGQITVESNTDMSMDTATLFARGDLTVSNNQNGCNGYGQNGCNGNQNQCNGNGGNGCNGNQNQCNGNGQNGCNGNGNQNQCNGNGQNGCNGNGQNQCNGNGQNGCNGNGYGNQNQCNGYGGQINLRSYNGQILWTNGVGDVRPTGSAVPTNKSGVIILTYSVNLDTTNTVFPSNGNPTTPGLPVVLSGGSPTIPSSVVLPTF
jgi:hypothetical protein